MRARGAKTPDPQETNSLIRFFAEGKYTEAETLAKSMTVRFPQFDLGWTVLGATFAIKGQAADALIPMQNAVALSPSKADTHGNLGNTLRALGRLDEAEASYRRALQVNPNHAEAHSKLGNLLSDLGRLD